jgi:hypothetical protein
MLCVLAVLVMAVPGVGYARAAGGQSVHLDDGPQHVVLPADQTYGIYVDDADNSGYSERCSAVDARGQHVQMADPWWSVSDSNTEMLDIVFNTGSGNLTIDCSIPGEHVTVRPVPNLRALVLGVAGGGILGLAGAFMLLVWLIGRQSRRRSNPPGSSIHDRSSSSNEQALGRMPAEAGMVGRQPRQSPWA